MYDGTSVNLCYDPIFPISLLDCFPLQHYISRDSQIVLKGDIMKEIALTCRVCKDQILVYSLFDRQDLTVLVSHTDCALLGE